MLLENEPQRIVNALLDTVTSKRAYPFTINTNNSFQTTALFDSRENNRVNVQSIRVELTEYFRWSISVELHLSYKLYFFAAAISSWSLFNYYYIIINIIIIIFVM